MNIKKLVLLLVLTLIMIRLNAQFGGGAGSLNNPYQINSIVHLNNIRGQYLDSHFLQTADLDLSKTNPVNVATWEPGSSHQTGDFVKHPEGGSVYTWMCTQNTSDAPGLVSNSWVLMWESVSGWSPIGNETTPFRGSYDGGNYSISGLWIERQVVVSDTTQPSLAEIQNLPEDCGLFGLVSSSENFGAELKNIALKDCYVLGGRNTGCLSGRIMIPQGANIVRVIACRVFNDESISMVKGFGACGGLIGSFGSIQPDISPYLSYSYSEAEVHSRFPLDATIDPSANGAIFNSGYGGLVGLADTGIISDCYALGRVSGGNSLGGLAGSIIRGAVIRCYSTGEVRTDLSDMPYQPGVDPWCGGLIGKTHGQLSTSLGGYTGLGMAFSSFWNLESSGNDSSDGGEGLSSAALSSELSYPGWDFTGVWFIETGSTPWFRYQIGQNLNPWPSTFESIMYPTLVANPGYPVDPNPWLENTEGIYFGSLPENQERIFRYKPQAGQISDLAFAVCFSEIQAYVSGSVPTSDFGAYYRFVSATQEVTQGEYFELSLATRPINFWYRYSLGNGSSDWQLIPWDKINLVQETPLLYRISISGLLRRASSYQVEFIADAGSQILNLEVGDFSASPESGGVVKLNWTTLTEHNLRGFYINRGPTELLTHAILVSPLIAAANAPFSYNFEDREIPSDGAWYYWLQGIDLQGNSQLFGPVGVNVSTGSGEPPEPSLGTGITSLYPNPFSPNLKISYEIIEQNPVLFTIRIYNSRGQLVRNLVRTTKENCKESIFWDGKDDSGTDCSSGIYLIYMQAGSKESHKKAIMIK